MKTTKGNVFSTFLLSAVFSLLVFLKLTEGHKAYRSCCPWDYTWDFEDPRDTMYDTLGLLHPYLMSMRLNREEQKMVEIRKELQPRIYSIKAGETIHVGGLARLDLSHASVT